MPRKRKSTIKTAVTTERVSTTVSKKKKNKRAKRRSAPLATPVLDLARVISDPCGAPLRGMDVMEANLVERSRTFVGINGGQNTTCGYVVWFPSYTSHNNGQIEARSYNLYMFESASPSTRPTNTAGAGAMGLTTSGGQFIPDPASGMVTATSAFTRQKSYSACMQFEYLGALSEVQGQVAIVKNFSLAAFNHNTGSPGAAYLPLTVDEIFTYAQERERTQIGGHEVVWRPSVDSCVFRTSGNENISPAASGDFPDVVWLSGNSTGTTVERAVNPNNVYGIAIAWKGFPASHKSQVVCVKTYGLELAPRSGVIESIPRQLSADSESTYISRALAYLDMIMPNWQSKIMNAGIDKIGSYAASVAPAIIRGVGPRSNLRIMDGSL